MMYLLMWWCTESSRGRHLLVSCETVNTNQIDRFASVQMKISIHLEIIESWANSIYFSIYTIEQFFTERMRFKNSIPYTFSLYSFIQLNLSQVDIFLMIFYSVQLNWEIYISLWWIELQQMHLSNGQKFRNPIEIFIEAWIAHF